MVGNGQALANHRTENPKPVPHAIDEGSPAKAAGYLSADMADLQPAVFLPQSSHTLSSWPK